MRFWCQGHEGFCAWRLVEDECGAFLFTVVLRFHHGEHRRRCGLVHLVPLELQGRVGGRRLDLRERLGTHGLQHKVDARIRGLAWSAERVGLRRGHGGSVVAGLGVRRLQRSSFGFEEAAKDGSAVLLLIRLLFVAEMQQPGFNCRLRLP